ncbi:MAG: hypothetical protein EAZ89_10690 [Bacteroidetes bacterium]|nr:MAG: hypothetical protein EAZ89_10690 [Bacteroidota bacterium]
MPFSWWLALPFSVWIIYTADHLLDARRLGPSAHTARHDFHYRYMRPLSIACGLAIAFCLWLLTRMPIGMIYFGLIMAGLTLLHLLLVAIVGSKARHWLQKELGVGFIYSAGVWGCPPWLFPEAYTGATWGLFAQFFILAMINLLFFSLYERETDESDGHTSFVRAIGEQATRRVIAALGIAGALTGIGVLIWGNEKALIAEGFYLLMLGVLLWISFDPKRFAPRERYRIWGDAVFIFPVLVWLIA